MANTSSDRHAAAPWLGWLLIVLGAAGAMGWLVAGQAIGATIEVENMGAAMALYFAIVFVPMLVIALVLGRIGGIGVLRTGSRPGAWMALGLVSGALGLGVSAGYSWLNGGLVAGTAPGGFTAMLVLAAALTLLQVGTEEVFFRGWLQAALAERIGPMAALLPGAAIFALFHVPAGVTSPISAATLVLGGVWFGLLALRSGGILASMAAHYAWNAVEDQGLGLVPNPGTGTLGAYLDLDLLGSALWGGHEEGLNASIGTVIVMVALILPLLRRPVPKATAASL